MSTIHAQSTCPEAKLLGLLSQYPIFSSIAENLGFWDLIQLSRTCVAARRHSHGFTTEQFTPRKTSDRAVRESLHIGQHDTSTWRLYRHLTRKECCEPDHTSDHEPLGCKLCSKPVCFACIVKHSFGKPEKTFLLRGRALCKQCFTTGNPHSEYIAIHGSTPVRIRYAKSGLCHCTSQDGILCSGCKRKQNEESLHRYKRTCAGTDCRNSITTDSSTARVCLWCNCILPTSSLKQAYGPRKGYDADSFETGSQVRRYTSYLTANEDPESEPPEDSLEAEAQAPQSTTPRVLHVSAPSLPQDQYWLVPPDAEVPAYSRYPVNAVASRSSQLQA